MTSIVLQADNLTVRMNGNILLDKISFAINQGEQWAILGKSGTGKTTLLKALAGIQYYQGSLMVNSNIIPSQNITFVEQQHHFKNLSNTNRFYYQQRFNSADSEDSISVFEDLNNYISTRDKSPTTIQQELLDMVKLFHLEKLLDERLIQLSNGENKRLQIAKALLSKPDILLLDNPFIGLDVEAREILEKVLSKIASAGIHTIVSTSHEELPHFVTHVLTLHEDRSFTKSPIGLFLKNRVKVTDDNSLQFDNKLFLELISYGSSEEFTNAVIMDQVRIEYNGRKILDNINWQVKKGERWSLSGPNGAGKSTLLSLVNADNPQAYANKIFLFDRRRGTGETIWDIKKKIGYISPELHLHFEGSDNCFQVVASGLFDTIGLFRQLHETHIELVNQWMQLLNIHHLAEKMLFRLSNSEQRLVLLARALVKNPPMLILDEPCQCLDDVQIVSFKSLINEICIAGNKTLIYVSHYPHEIPECVNQFLRLENGRRVN